MIASPIRRTPVVPDPGHPGVFYKLESLQRSGSFKLRGAWQVLSTLDEASARRGVVAASAGNHGAALALVGKLLGIPVTVVVPETTPQIKLAKMNDAGAEVLVRGEDYDAASLAATDMARKSHREFVSPFDDERVIVGNGDSLAQELAGQLPNVARVVVPVGGGGLIAGIARTLAPRGIEVIGAQPSANCAMHQSLALGRALVEYDGSPTMAEGLAGPVSQLTFEICRTHGVRTFVANEQAIAAAVADAYSRLGLIVETSAAVAMAVLASLPPATPERPTLVVITGGNIDDSRLDACVGANEVN